MDRKTLTQILYTSLGLAIVSDAAQAKAICTPVVDGKNIIKAGKGNCATTKEPSKHGCDGLNPVNEAEAWIEVDSEDICTAIKDQNWAGVPEDTCDRIEGCIK